MSSNRLGGPKTELISGSSQTADFNEVRVITRTHKLGKLHGLIRSGLGVAPWDWDIESDPVESEAETWDPKI